VRILERNKQELWYANPTGWQYAVDANGFKTGDKDISYGTPVQTRMSMAISSGANNLGSQGIAEVEPYGIVTGYTHRAVTEDLTCTMGEESRVWFGIEPTREETTIQTVNGVQTEVKTTVAVPHNFEVVRKAKSLNHLIYYLKEVDVQ
jgi:hypothetical protein